MKKLLSVLLAVLLITVNIPVIVSSAVAVAPFVVTTDVETSTVKRGDTITVTVSMGAAYKGYAVTTLFLRVSDNLTLVEEDSDFSKASSGPNAGAYGCPIMNATNIKYTAGQEITEAQFTVNDDATGEVSIQFYAYGTINQNGDDVPCTVNGNADTDTLSYLVQGTDFKFTSSASTYVNRGDTITYTVKTGETNKGFKTGDILFIPSDNLTLTEGQSFTKITEGDNAGAYKYSVNLAEANTSTNTDVVSIKFDVNNDASGDVSVKFLTDNLVDGAATPVPVSVIVNGKAMTDTLKSTVYVAVTDITLEDDDCEERTDFTLNADISPADAAATTIVWTVKDAGETGATISGNTLSTTKMGSVTVTASIESGLTPDTAFTKDFVITVEMDYSFADAIYELDNYTFNDIAQTTANTESDVKTYFENAIKDLLSFDTDIDVTVNIKEFTAAIAGSAETTHEGTNGSAKFDVTISKLTNTYTLEDATIAITATQFDGMLDTEVVEAALLDMYLGSYTDMTQAAATSTDVIKAHIKSEVETAINNSDVTVEIVEVSYTPAVAGTSATPAGTNGTYNFKVKVTKGQANDTSVESSINIIATEFDGTSDADAVLNAKNGLTGATLDVDFPGSADQKLAVVKDYVDDALTTIDHTPDVTAEVVLKSGSTYTVTFNKGSESQSGDYDFSFNVAPDPDIAILADAMALVDAYTFEDIAQADAETADDAAGTIKATVEDIINNPDITVTINTVSFTAAVPSTRTSHDHTGTNGSYSFTVTLSKGSQENTSVSNDSVNIIATYFNGDLDCELVQEAKEAVENYTFEDIAQADANTEEEIKALIIDKVNDIVDNDEVTVSVTVDSLTAAVAGSASTSHEGTNGTATVSVTLTVGSESDSVSSISFDINATVYEGYLDSEVVDEGESILDETTFEDYDMADINTADAANADIKSQVEALIENALGDADHSDYTVTVTNESFTAAVAGTAATTHEGTNGEYSFKVTVTCGASSYTTYPAITVNINATEYDGYLDSEVVDEAESILDSTTFNDFEMADVNTDEAANTAIKAQVEALIENALGDADHSDYTVTVTNDSFTAAVAGSATTSHAGTNGEYSFKVTVTCGASTYTTDPAITVAINATSYDGYLDTEAVDNSKTYINNNPLTINQADAETKSAAEAKLKAVYESELADYGVTVTVTGSDFTPAVAGSKTTTHEGTNGSIKYTVSVSAGAELYTSEELTAVIKATSYDGVLDTEALQAIVDSIQNFDIEVEKGASDEDKTNAVLEYMKGLVPEQYRSSASVTLVSVNDNVYTVELSYAGLTETKDVTVEITEKTKSNSVWAQIRLAYLNLMNSKFTVNAVAGEGGSITNEGKTKYKFGDYVTYTITPNEGYAVKSVTVNGKDKGAVTTIKLSEIRNDYTIVVTFEKIETPNEWINPFTDITESDPYYDAVKFVNENSLFLGTSASTFSPEKTMTRAMFVTVLGRLSGVDVSEYTTNSFNDVQAGEWYTEYVEWASQNNIVNGYGNGVFAPNKQISVQEAIVIISRYAEFINCNTASTTDLSSYTDGDQVANWASSQMSWALENGIYTATDNSLVPTAPASRALVATLLYNFVNQFVK